MVTKLSQEKFPISESLKVMEGITIYKTDKWWAAVTIIESFGRKQIATYCGIRKVISGKGSRSLLLPERVNDYKSEMPSKSYFRNCLSL